MPLNLKDPKSGMDYFTAATMFAKLANANTPPSQVQAIPYFENLFPAAAGVNGSYCNGPTTPNPTATQSMYEMFQCNWGASTLGASNFINVFDTNCFPSCLQLPGQPAGGVPFQFYNPQFTALYAWSSMGTSAYNAGQFTLRSRPAHGLQFDFNRPGVLGITIRTQRTEIEGDFAAPCFPSRQAPYRRTVGCCEARPSANATTKGYHLHSHSDELSRRQLGSLEKKVLKHPKTGDELDKYQRDRCR